MPYSVESHCSACGEGDTFAIGLWPEHLGVFVCSECQSVVNIPLSTGQCPGCGYSPTLDEYYDYAYAIPYLNYDEREPRETLEPGPICPKCGGSPLSFRSTEHVNVGRLGSTTEKAWLGVDSLEKAIFLYAMLPVLHEFDLDNSKVMAYYNIDPPGDKSLLLGRRISLPIRLDIRNHLLAVQMAMPELFESLKA